MDPATLSAIKQAIDASEKSEAEPGKRSAPPKVGAALIFPDGRVETAYRGEMAPGDHAEFTLLEKKLKGVDVCNCTLITTLEPCTTRSPEKRPCCDRILDRGIKNVIIGTLDPNPEIYGHGYRKLMNAGVNVTFVPTDERNEIVVKNGVFFQAFEGNQASEGEVQFDYEKHSTFGLGFASREFKTAWSPGGDTSVWCYNGHVEITPCPAREIHEIRQSDQYDFKHQRFLISKGEILVARNRQGFFAAIKILDVKPRKPHELSSVLRIAYQITNSRTGDFSLISESAFEVDSVKSYSFEWAKETIANAFKLFVYPTLKRVHEPFDGILAAALRVGPILGVAEDVWQAASTRYDDPVIEIVRETETYRTFKVTVRRTLSEEEMVSKRLRASIESWDVDVMISIDHERPTAISVTRIKDITGKNPMLWKGALPQIDVREYL